MAINGESEKSIRDVYKSLWGAKRLESIFKWPPDAFVFTSILLSESGAYRCVVAPINGKEWPPKGADSWTEIVEDVGERWRKSWSSNKQMVSDIKSRVAIIKAQFDTPVSELSEHSNYNLCIAIVELHIFADQACAGVGIPGGMPDNLSAEEMAFYSTAFLNLQQWGSLSTLHVSRAKVLPKVRTPQIGISLRSLSHYLAFDESEVSIEWLWQPIPTVTASKTLNVLVIPWPFVIEASHFIEVKGDLKNLDKDRFGFFDFKPDQKMDFKVIEGIIKSAKVKIKRLDGVILPECALDKTEVKKFESLLSRLRIPFFIAGVRAEKSNYAHLGFLFMGEYQSHIQHKHHRWQIDSAQIQTYHLGSSLHPSKKYWEAIDVKKRTVRFVSVNDWLTMCHLICEDLARHDPVTQVVRSVGPNLVVSLLLDGPQLAARWPGRYASVLADDPGSSVLTVTSLGMSVRSLPAGQAVKRVIALWKDTSSGPKEISLPDGKSAAILTLCSHSQDEVTADGRSDGGMAGSLEFAGVQYV